MINAIVQNKQGETAVIDLTVHYHEIYKELQTLDYYGSPKLLPLRDDEGYYSPASNYTISDNRDKIEDMLGIEQLPDLGDMAQYILGKLLYRGEIIPQDLEWAVGYLERSAAQDNPYAAYSRKKKAVLNVFMP